MKKFVFLPLLLMAILPGFVVAEEENPFEEKMPFENAMISYAISGVENGTEVLYIADYGKKNATYRKTATSMMGMTMENNTIEIMDDDWLYSYDLVEGTGSKSRNPMKYMQEEYAKLSAAEKEQVLKNRELMGTNMMAGVGGKVEKKVTEILGYQCDRMTAMGTTVYSIHESSITLKTESEVMGMKMETVATAIDTGKVDEKYFLHPEGIEVVHDEEADDMSRQMAQQTLDWLKDPEASSKPMQMGDLGGQSDRMQYIPEQDQEMIKQAQEMLKGMKGAMGNQ